MIDFGTGGPLADNIAGLTFAEQEGSFLVGAAAALKTGVDKIGFIGGVCCYGGIEPFEAGFIAGAKAVNPNIEILSQYVTEAPDFDGFNAPDRGKEIALAMFEDGADIVYHAAGGTGAGLFQAAKEHSDSEGSKVWAIGVDFDQHNVVDDALKPHVLSSMLKEVGSGIYLAIESHITGNWSAGQVTYSLENGGVGYATSGGYVDDIVDQLEAFKAQIVGGDITVSRDPTDY